MTDKIGPPKTPQRKGADPDFAHAMMRAEFGRFYRPRSSLGGIVSDRDRQRSPDLSKAKLVNRPSNKE